MKSGKMLAANTVIPGSEMRLKTLRLQTSSLQSKRLEAAHKIVQQSLEKTKICCFVLPCLSVSFRKYMCWDCAIASINLWCSWRAATVLSKQLLRSFGHILEKLATFIWAVLQTISAASLHLENKASDIFQSPVSASISRADSWGYMSCELEHFWR